MSEKLSNKFFEMPFSKGDIVYFGIHDLSKKYRENNCLPNLSLYDVFNKKGEISSLDPISQMLIVSLEESPFNLGYRRLNACQNYNSKKLQVKIPSSYLQNITHIMEDDSINVYLIIDGETKYQNKLLKYLRKREIDKLKNSDHKQFATRHYDEFEGDDFYLDDSEDFKNENTSYFNYNPNLLSKQRGWKYFKDNKVYKSYNC